MQHAPCKPFLWFVYVCLLFALIGSAALHAQASLEMESSGFSTWAAPKWKVVHWTAAEGFPGTTIVSLLQTDDGYLWIATDAGLVRFDGDHFELVLNANAVSLAEDENGSLWIGTTKGLVARHGNSFAQPPGLEHNALNSDGDVIVARRRAGGIWAASDHRLAAVNDLEAQILLEIPGARGVSSLFEDSTGHLWFSTRSKILRCDPSASPIILQEICPIDESRRTPAFFEDAQGRIWIGTGGFNLGPQLISWPDQQGATITQISTNAFGPVTAVAEYPIGVIWAGTAAGLFQVAPDSQSRTVAQGALNDLPNITCLLADYEGQFWIGTKNRGLFRLTRDPITMLTTSDGLLDNNVHSVLQARDGGMWFATDKGLTSFNNKKVTNIIEPWNLKSPINTIAEDAEGTIWAGLKRMGRAVPATTGPFSSDGGLRSVVLERNPIFQLEKLVLVPFGRPLVDIDLRGLAPAPDGSLFVVHAEGLSRISKGETAYQKACVQLLQTSDLCSVFLDRRANLWVSGSVIRRLENGIWTVFGPEAGLDPGRYSVAHEDETGALWILSEGQGVLRLKDGRFCSITSAQGLPSDTTLALLEDEFGRFWFQSPQDIFWVAKENLRNVADGKEQSVACFTYGIEGGFSMARTGSDAAPGACKTRDGLLCFPTRRGVAIVHSREVRAEPYPPVRISGLQINGQVLRSDLPPSLPVQTGEIRLPARASSSLLVRFSTVSLSSPRQVRVRYRLRGRSDAWVETLPRMPFRIEEIRPGRYTLELTAASPRGAWNPQPARLALYIPPPILQSHTFFAFLGAAFLFVGWSLRKHRIRLRDRIARLEREASLARERERFARDLHDDVGASLTRIAMLSDAVRQHGDLNGAAHQIERISAISREVIDNMSELVWASNPRYDDLQSFASYLREYAALLFAPTAVRFDFHSDVLDNIALSSEIRRDLFLVLKEALNNILKHSSAQNVSLTLCHRCEALTITLQDDGIGLPAATRAFGNGLRNMQQRVENLGGTFGLSSSHGLNLTVSIALRSHASSKHTF